jgi:hypothetical protein
VKAERRATAREYKWPVPTPDGCGVCARFVGELNPAIARSSACSSAADTDGGLARRYAVLAQSSDRS